MALTSILAAQLGLACFDEPTHLRRGRRDLVGVSTWRPITPARPPQPPAELVVPVVMEDRGSLDWTYIPNYDYHCEEIGCCGMPDEINPTRQPCGPELWHFLNDNTSRRCVSDGESVNQQSPIRIMTGGPEKMTLYPIMEKIGNKTQVIPQFSNTKCKGSIAFARNTWEVDFSNDCHLHVYLFGKRYHLVNFHFHNSEHVINGVYLPLEVHMVHRARANDSSSAELTNDFLVLSVFLVPGKESAYFKALEATPGHAGNDSDQTSMVNPYVLVPQSRKYWHYEGSLTTPPCQVADDSKVQWVLFQEPDTLSMNQLGFFGSYFADIRKSYNGEVNRPIQKVNKQTKIYEYTHESLNHGPVREVLSAKGVKASGKKGQQAGIE